MANQPKTLIESAEFRSKRMWLDKASQQRLEDIAAKHDLAHLEGNEVERRKLYAVFLQSLALYAKMGRKESKVFRTSIVLPESLIYQMRSHDPMFSFSQWCSATLADRVDELNRLNLPPEAQPKPEELRLPEVPPRLSQDMIDSISRDREQVVATKGTASTPQRIRAVLAKPNLERAVAGALGINTDDWDEGESK